MGFFKACPTCETAWDAREAFLDDPNIEPIGLQANFEEMEKGFFLFNHVNPDDPECRTSLAVAVGEFLDLVPPPAHTKIMAGEAVCEGHCVHVEDLETCDAPCPNATPRKILQIILRRHRAAVARRGGDPDGKDLGS